MVLNATFNRGKRKSASTRRSQSLSPLKSICHPVEDVLIINHYVTLVCQLFRHVFSRYWAPPQTKLTAMIELKYF